MWHLKYNVKAFAPEELAKYPEWFSKKVEGFEENILGRLKNWELSPLMGEGESLVAHPPSNSLPSREGELLIKEIIDHLL